MSVATSCITDKFKNTYVMIGKGPDEELQKALFIMGARWCDERRVNESASTYISINDAFQLSYSSDPDATPNSYDWNKDKFKMVLRYEVLEAAEQVRKIKRHESKAQRKRAAKRKWDAEAIPHIVSGRPVDYDTVVSYKQRNGQIYTARAGWCDWNVGVNALDIVSYKVLTPNKHRPVPQESVVTLENMLTDVAWDLGKGVAVPVHDYSHIETKERQPAPNDCWCVGCDPENCSGCPPLQKESVAPDTNPKRQYGVASVPLNMWSPLASAYGSLGLYNGALKYGKANFANTPVEASIYIAAAMRHLSAWACGQEFDPADGVPNLAGVLANIAILLEARAAGMLIDDRLKMAGYLKELEQLKEIVKHLNKLHEGKNPKHYTLEEK